MEVYKVWVLLESEMVRWSGGCPAQASGGGPAGGDAASGAGALVVVLVAWLVTQAGGVGAWWPGW